MNPIITHTTTADPTVLVSDDRLFLFTGHDEAAPGTHDYIMNHWLCFSTRDLKIWDEHPVPLTAASFKWAKGDAFASKVLERNGRYYWFAAVTHAAIEGKAIALAVSDRPAGPYRDELGKALISHDMLPPTSNKMANMDPTVIIDEEDIAHIFWGKDVCYHTTLDADMNTVTGDISIVDLPLFSEGAHVHYKDGWYYLSYGYGFPEKVAYAMSRSLYGPWQFKGILNEIAGNCETNRAAIVDFNGKSLFFYHNGALPDGSSQRRSVCVDHLYYNKDRTLRRVVMTTEGLDDWLNT